MPGEKQEGREQEEAKAQFFTGVPPLELATAYIPPQTLDRTYSPAEGLTRGTLFPELYRPYPYSLAR